MSNQEAPDRRPLIYMVLAVAILGIAAVLFWPRSDTDSNPSMVLRTPASVESVDAEKPDVNEAGIAGGTAVLPQTEGEAPETIDSDPFPVEDAKLDESALVQKTPAAAPTPPKTEAIASTSEIRPGSTGSFLLNVGSFKDEANAERLNKKLNDADVRAYVTTAQTASSGQVYRVHVGFFQTSSAAEEYSKYLKKEFKLDSWMSQR